MKTKTKFEINERIFLSIITMHIAESLCPMEFPDYDCYPMAEALYAEMMGMDDDPA